MRMSLSLSLSLSCCLVVAGSVHADEQRTLDKYRASAERFEAAAAAERRGLRSEARVGYERALASDPEFVEALVNLARLELADGDLVACARWLDRAEALRADYALVASTRGLLALASGDGASALEAFERARRISPDDAEIGVNLGATLIARGRIAEAKGVLAELLRAEPDHTEALYNLALADDLGGDRDAARLGYERFLALARTDDPDRDAVRQRLDELSAERVSMRESSLASEVRPNLKERGER